MVEGCKVVVALFACGAWVPAWVDGRKGMGWDRCGGVGTGTPVRGMEAWYGRGR